MGEAIYLVEKFNLEKVIFNCGKFNNLEQDLIEKYNLQDIDVLIMLIKNLVLKIYFNMIYYK